MVEFLACVALFNALGLVIPIIALRGNVETDGRNHDAAIQAIGALRQRLTKLEERENK